MKNRTNTLTEENNVTVGKRKATMKVIFSDAGTFVWCRSDETY